MKRYSELIEGFKLTGKTLNYDPSFDDTVINTELGKKGFKIRETTLKSKIKVYSVFSKTHTKDETELTSTDMLKILKGQNEITIPNNDLELLLERAAILMYHHIQYMPIDYILSIGSTSDLSTKFIDHILTRLPYQPKVLLKSIHKSKDFEKLYYDKPDWLTPSITKLLDGYIKKAQQTHELQIKKVYVQYRDLIHGWLEIDNDILKKISGKSVCIVDDYITTGSTFDEAVHLIKQYNPSNIFGITLIK